MCTAIAIRKNGLFFGRNMDIENHFGERIIYTPRHFSINYRHEADEGGYSVLGIGTVIDGVPLYADGVNEKGLCIAGLNFRYNAKYGKSKMNEVNLAPYEIIPYLLRRCESVGEIKKLISTVNITDTPINSETPIPYLHFFVADKHSSMVIEPTFGGVKLYDNPYNILTNNPQFPYHLSRLKQYSNLENRTPPATFYKKELYSLGLGAYGLPGDPSSSSRFVRGEYFLRNLVVEEGEETASTFRVLDALVVPKGAVMNESGKEHYTIYSCCIDADNLCYHVRSYDGLAVKSVFLCNLDSCGNSLSEFDFQLKST